MNKFLSIFSLSIGRKLLMALTGLFLSLFLVIHCVGNLQLFRHDNGYAFNTYTVMMTTNPLIKMVSYILYASIVLHSILALILTIKNKSARSKKYEVAAGNATSKWHSRNMGLLGTVLLFFIVVHMSNYWYTYKFGTTPWALYSLNLEDNSQMYQDVTAEVAKFPKTPDYKMQEINIQGQKALLIKDLYQVVKKSFEQELWIVILYVLSMIAVSFHVLHGFRSAFQTLGVNHKTYSPIISGLGMLLAIVLPLLFAAMPLYFYLNKA